MSHQEESPQPSLDIPEKDHSANILTPELDEKPPYTHLPDDRQAETDAQLGERHPQPPLSEEQIRKLALHRGQRPTQEEIDGMNSARAAGIHTSIV